MSRELGGRSDKFGNEFERLWVVSLALRILDGQATRLRWEPLGFEGDGSDIVTVKYGERTWEYDFGENTITEIEE